MSNRSNHWKRIIGYETGGRESIRIQAGGDVEKVIPRSARGTGAWLGKGDGRGTQCTKPMKPEKEARVREIAKIQGKVKR